MKTPSSSHSHQSAFTSIRFALGIVLSTTLIGCASVPIPSEQMAVSKAAVANAVGAGANELAAGDMRLARDKLDRANAALVAEDYLLACSLAEQAEVDAQLAVTRSRLAKAQKAANALQEDNRVLREEIDRKNK
jgi:Domain of unknown function (DUF4398)